MVNWLTRKKVLSSGGTFLLWGGLWLGRGGCVLSLGVGVLLFVGCAPRGEYVTFTGFQQGTTYSIIVRDPVPDTAARIDSVFRAIDLTFSMFNPESLVSRINRGETDRVTPLFAECFQLARQIHRDTEGLYDPTVKPLIDAWGFGPGAMQRRPNLDSLLEFVGLDKIALAEVGEMSEVGGTGEAAETGGGGAGNGEAGGAGEVSEVSGAGEVGWRIVKSDPRVQLDFSSIAKGFTVDKIAELLAQTSGDASQTALRGGWPGGSHKKPSSRVAQSAVAGRGGARDGAGGEADFLVEIGGEIRVQGVNRQGSAWRIQIDRPEGGFAHQQAAVITLGGRNTKPATQGRNAESAARDGNADARSTSPSLRDTPPSQRGENQRPTTQARLTAVATSGNYRNHFVDEDGATRVHTVDPHSGAPAAGQILSASVVSTSCARSDGWATALIAARDLSTARRLLDNAALLAADADNPVSDRQPANDIPQHTDDSRLFDVGQRSDVGRAAKAPALEWYIISEDGVEQSPGFPIDPK